MKQTNKKREIISAIWASWWPGDNKGKKIKSRLENSALFYPIKQQFSVLLGPWISNISITSGNLLEMQTLRSPPQPYWIPGVGPSNLWFNWPNKWSWHMLKCEKHNYRVKKIFKLIPWKLPLSWKGMKYGLPPCTSTFLLSWTYDKGFFTDILKREPFQSQFKWTQIVLPKEKKGKEFLFCYSSSSLLDVKSQALNNKLTI